MLVVIMPISIIAIKNVLEETKTKDPSYIVVDEFIGVFTSVLFISDTATWLSFIIMFILFRFFDIVKPFPVSILDRLSKHGNLYRQAFFVIADDIAAAVLAGGVYKIIMLLNNRLL